MANKVLYEIEVNANLATLNKLEVQLDNLKNSRKALLKIQKEQGSLNEQQRLSLTKLNQEIGKTSAKMQGVRTDIKNTAKANVGLGTSYDNLTAKNAIFAKRLREVQDPLGAGKKRVDALSLAIKKNTDTLKTMDAAMGRQQRNVGNYGESFSALTPLMGSFGSKISMIQGSLGTLGKSFGALKGSQEKAAVSSRMLGLSMMAIPIFALIGGITALVAAFASTQEGADELNKIMYPIKAIFDALLGVVQKLSFGAFDKLKEAIDNPKQAFIDLGKTIVDNVLNRFKAFGVFIEAIVLAVQGEFKASMLKGADAVIQFGTGVTNGTDKLQNYGEQLSDVAKRAAEVGAQILALQIKFEEMEIATTVPLANMRLEYQKLKEIANDQLLTEIERIEALEKAMNVQREIAKVEGKLLQMRIDKMKLEQSLSNTPRTAQLELQKLLEEQLQFEEAAQKKISGLRALQSGLEKKWYAERAKQQKFFSDLRIKDEEYELKKILKIREEAAKKEEQRLQEQRDKEAEKRKEWFDEQYDEAKKDQDRRIEIENAVKQESIKVAQQTSDALFKIQMDNNNRQMKYALDQLSIQNDLENDLLKSKLDSGFITQEEYENNRIALAQRTAEEEEKIKREQFEKNKKLQIAQAIANGALAVTAIMTVPDFTLGVASAIRIGAAVAATGIQVATIASTQYAKGGILEGNSHANGGIPMLVDGKRPIEAEGGEAIINKKSVAMFGKELDYINRAGGGVGLFEKGGYIRKFANGGLVSSGGMSETDLTKQAQMIASSINNLKVINVASETVNKYNNAIKIENEATL